MDGQDQRVEGLGVFLLVFTLFLQEKEQCTINYRNFIEMIGPKKHTRQEGAIRTFSKGNYIRWLICRDSTRLYPHSIPSPTSNYSNLDIS